MKKYQDIQVNDVALRKQFVTAWLNGNYSQAFDIIQNGPQVQTKAFVADCFNSMVTAVNVLENYFYSGVTEEFSILLTEFNAGLDEFRSRGAWNASTSYIVGNFVVYNDALYLCIADNNNKLPTNTSFWVYLNLRGEMGTPYFNAQMKYQWRSDVGYVVRDVVIVNNTLYIAKFANTNQLPITATNYWDILLQLPKPKIIVSETAPTGIDAYDGLIWCQILT